MGCVHRDARKHADASSASEMAADGGSSSLQLPCVFSPKSRQFLALCAQDGRLRIWNTDSKTLHQEYVPSAHLSATCTCIAWGPCRTVKVREAVVSVSSEARIKLRLTTCYQGAVGKTRESLLFSE